jgi:hypothetical protein
MNVPPQRGVRASMAELPRAAQNTLRKFRQVFSKNKRTLEREKAERIAAARDELAKGRPEGGPDVLSVEFVGSLPPNFNARDRLSCANDRLDDFFYLIRDLWNGFADRSPDMISDRNSPDFCQTMIDLPHSDNRL